ncbi:MAG TPA: VTT domain-containing protein [Acidobacteriota bacterium]|jgi:membrane protein YqaA with SNARE-associated domain
MGLLRGIALKAYAFASGLGGPGVFLIAVADSSFLSVPEGNDLLIVILSIGQSWSRMCYLVLMTTAGSALGCTLLYTVGRKGGAYIHRISRNKLRSSQALYQKYGLWTIVVSCMLPPPMPFKVFVLSAGLFQVSFRHFLIAVLVGRSARYFTWGILAVLFGKQVKTYIQDNLPAVGTALFVAVLLILALLFLSRRLGWIGVKGEQDA